MKKYILYCHTNKINGKKYIGITSTKPEKRWQNGKGYYSNSYFNSAILKYGWDAFLHEIWYTDLTVEEANALEIKMIEKYNSANREFGYNIDLGGNQTGKVSEETKRKHRENQLGEKSHWYGKTGALNPMFGKKMSEEQKEYRRILQTGKKHTEESKLKMSQNHHAKRKVVCVDTGEVFDSITIAANAKGLNYRHISEVCTGKLKTTGGLHWKYYEGGENE